MASLKSTLKNSVRLPAIFGEGHAINRAAIDRAAWASLKPSIYSTGELDAARAIDLVATYLVPLVSHTFKPEFSREWLKATLLKGLREGRLNITIGTIAVADAGNEIADEALRTVYAEIPLAEAAMLAQQNNAYLHIISYGKRAVLHAPHKRPRGRHSHDNWMRDIQICLLIIAVSRELGVPPARNRTARRAPSAISIVVDALARRGDHFNEVSVQENIWFGSVGELVRDIVDVYPPQP